MGSAMVTKININKHNKYNIQQKAEKSKKSDKHNNKVQTTARNRNNKRQTKKV